MRRDELYANDTVWARFYRDNKTLGEITKEFNCSVYDLSPWLTAPMVRFYTECAGEDKSTSKT